MAQNESVGLLSLWEPKNSAEANVDIVFIHGLNGDRKATWTFEKSNEFPTSFWPVELLPEKCPTARILTFGYNANFVHFYFSKKNVPIGTTIDDHSSLLLQELANLRSKTETTERPIIFVAHSLGGLVCANALSRTHAADEANKSLAKHTYGTVFLGTPFEGSTKSKPGLTALNILSWLGQKTNKEEIEKLDKQSEKLAEVRQAFLKFLKERDLGNLPGNVPVNVACFFESSPTFVYDKKKLKLIEIGVIVDRESAMLPGFDPVPISANHSGLCKFAGPWESGFQSVSLLLARWIKNLGADNRSSEPNSIHVSGEVKYENSHNYGGLQTGHNVTTKENGIVNTGSTGSPTFNFGTNPGQ